MKMGNDRSHQVNMIHSRLLLRVLEKRLFLFLFLYVLQYLRDSTVSVINMYESKPLGVSLTKTLTKYVLEISETLFF